MHAQGRRACVAVAAAIACAGGAAEAAAQSYTVPADNPFVSTPGARGEIWAYGLRNPWRFSFDRATGDLTIADVGQDAIEEIDLARAGTGAGANYGWSCFEGSLRFNDCPAPGHVPPAFEYSSAGSEARCSITGGYVVRDPALPSLAGRYLYGDFCTGELRTADLAAGTDSALSLVVPALSSFGEDAAGRIYAASLAGPVFRLRAGPLLEPIGVFNQPVYVTSAPGDANRLFVVEKGGTVKVVEGGVPSTFLDISADVATGDLERGLLSIAFAPDYATSGLFYVYYVDREGDIRIEEFPSRRLVLEQEHRQFANHNGGQLQFGPDGMLYAGLGDGGGGGDPLGNGQNLGTLLGKLIRIDP
jgi:glucose/arabinose dehydrogenase